MKTALLLIAHGSRHEEANADLFALAQELREAYPIVEAAFLELATPTVDDAGRRCATLGAECVILVPYFLSAGVHVRRDLSSHRDRLAAEFVEIQWRLAEPIGRHPLMREIVLDRVKLTEKP
jgi:sirohydrochlorin ferrochelatase